VEKVTIGIKGMRCLSCSERLEEALSKLSFVRSVHADFALSECVVEYEGILPRKKLEGAIKAAGFKLA